MIALELINDCKTMDELNARKPLLHSGNFHEVLTAAVLVGGVVRPDDGNFKRSSHGFEDGNVVFDESI